MFYIIGLGNPGTDYEMTRHNTGRIVLAAFLQKNDFPEAEFVQKLNALVSEGKVGKEKVSAVMPETFMNKSGETAKKLGNLKLETVGKGKEKIREIENLAVIHDDLDIPFGKFKISFNKSSGGHKGVESIIKAVKTEGFIRIRVGICPVTPSGKLKKPSGDKIIGDFILAKFKLAEWETLKKVAKSAAEALALIIEEGKEKAMGRYNGL